MSEQLFEFISAIAGVMLLFGFIGFGCAVWEIIIRKWEDRKFKERQLYRKWNLKNPLKDGGNRSGEYEN